MKYLLLVAVLVFPSVALANADSLLTVGFGGGLGIQHINNHKVLTSEGKIRLRMLRGMGLELSYNPTVSQNKPYDSSFRLSGLLYLAPTSPVGVFLKFGVGSDGFKRMFDLRDASASYHGGLGFDLFLGDSLTVGLEGLTLLPSVGTIKCGIEKLIEYKASVTLMYYL